MNPHDDKPVIVLRSWKRGMKLRCKNCQKGKFEVQDGNECPKCGQSHIVKVSL